MSYYMSRNLVVAVFPTLLLGTVACMPRVPGPGPVLHARIKTAGDLRYVDVAQGRGAVAEDGKRVKVHYTGWLADGTKFDSSVDRGEPIEFDLGVGRVIKGWDKGLVGMHVGGKRRLIIPPQLGYGSVPHGEIPANSVLTFDVELIDVQ